MRQINDIIGGVSKDWQPQFRQFVETGKLDKGFEAYLNEDPAAQQAFDEVLDAQAAAFSDFNQALAESSRQQPASVNGPAPAGSAAVVSADPTAPRVEEVAVVMENALGVPELESYVTILAKLMGARKWRELQAAVPSTSDPSAATQQANPIPATPAGVGR
jgi:hypothetical protein